MYYIYSLGQIDDNCCDGDVVLYIYIHIIIIVVFCIHVPVYSTCIWLPSHTAIMWPTLQYRLGLVGQSCLASPVVEQ